jgi:hypothetical protein
VDEAVWSEVRRRRGPSTWVLVVAILLGAAMIWAAFWMRGQGRTSPQLSSNGMSGKWDAGTSTVDVLVRLGNQGAVPVTVVGARLVNPDGSASRVARSLTVTPTVVPAGTVISDGGTGGIDVPMRVVVDCAWLDPNLPEPGPGLVLTTTGTWPQHDYTLSGFAAIDMFCNPAAGSGS